MNWGIIVGDVRVVLRRWYVRWRSGAPTPDTLAVPPRSCCGRTLCGLDGPSTSSGARHCWRPGLLAHLDIANGVGVVVGVSVGVGPVQPCVKDGPAAAAARAMLVKYGRLAQAGPEGYVVGSPVVRG